MKTKEETDFEQDMNLFSAWKNMFRPSLVNGTREQWVAYTDELNDRLYKLKLKYPQFLKRKNDDDTDY